MGKHISDSLGRERCLIMNTDQDQPAVADIYVGFNFRNQLVICVDYTDYDNPGHDCSTAAVVNIDDAHAMARRNGVEHRKLPAFIARCMAYWGEIVNATPRQAGNCFKEMTECLLDEGCRFVIERTYGRHGFFRF